MTDLKKVTFEARAYGYGYSIGTRVVEKGGEQTFVPDGTGNLRFEFAEGVLFLAQSPNEMEFEYGEVLRHEKGTVMKVRVTVEVLSFGVPEKKLRIVR